MNTNWINFKELRSKLSFIAILEKYGAKVNEKGGQLVGFCPLPGHSGNRNSPSFSAHPEKGIFQCFGCGGKGNILDFAVLMENGNLESGTDLRNTALMLCKQFGIQTTGEEKQKHPRSSNNKKVLVNEPLNFRLKDLDPGHPYLRNRGFARETMEKFGVGLCRKGLFAGRITIPLHNGAGKLIGYAGRVINDDAITAENPKYLFPGKRELDGTTFEFKKSLFLYNAHRIKRDAETLIIVEGFPSVWWLDQMGFPGAVAIMGSAFSGEQVAAATALLKPEGHVIVMTDGDSAGFRCGTALCAVFSKSHSIRMLVTEGKQPTDYTEEELQNLLPS